MPDDIVFSVGDHVINRGGGYHFTGAVVAAFRKRSGEVRYVVENEYGILQIFSVTEIKLDVTAGEE